jgi:hypothetical protein
VAGEKCACGVVGKWVGPSLVIRLKLYRNAALALGWASFYINPVHIQTRI